MFLFLVSDRWSASVWTLFGKFNEDQLAVLLWLIFVDSHKSGRLQSIIHADPTVLYTKICPTLKKNAGMQLVFRYMGWVFHCTWIPLELGVGSPLKSRVDCRGKNRTWPSCSPSGTWASWTGGWPPCPGRYGRLGSLINVLWPFIKRTQLTSRDDVR